MAGGGPEGVETSLDNLTTVCDLRPNPPGALQMGVAQALASRRGGRTSVFENSKKYPISSKPSLS